MFSFINSQLKINNWAILNISKYNFGEVMLSPLINFIWLIWKYLNDSKTPNNIIFQLELQNPNKLHMKYSSTTFEKVILFSLQNCDCGFQYFKKSQTEIKALWFSWINFPNHSFLYWTKMVSNFYNMIRKSFKQELKRF